MKRLMTMFAVLAFSLLLLAGCHPEAEETVHDNLLTQENGKYSITLPVSGGTISVHKTYGKYMPYVTDALIRAADNALSKIAAENNEDSFDIYLSTDQDGYLCLCLEVIVYFEPEEENMNGCGIDHDHVFYQERISTHPLE